jgi:hypothetical protein
MLHRRGINFEVGLEVSDHDDMKAALADLEKQRQKVANHAYGFISRGNREGGSRTSAIGCRKKQSPVQLRSGTSTK